MKELIKKDGEFEYAIEPANFRIGKYVILVLKNGKIDNRSALVYFYEDALKIIDNSQNGTINE